MAMDELKCIGEGLVSSLKHDTTKDDCLLFLSDRLSGYEQLLEIFQKETKRFSRSAEDTILTASMKLAYSPGSYFYEDNEFDSYEDDVPDIIAQYSSKGHHGIAYLLHMKRFMRDYDLDGVRHTVREKEKAIEFLGYRKEFIQDVHKLFSKLDLLGNTIDDIKFWLGFDLHETQLFVPRVLCRVPTVLSAIYEDGRKDCLRRSVRHIAYDAGAKLPHGEFEAVDDINDDMSADILGRTALHQAVLSEDLDFLERMETTSSEMNAEALGLKVLHMAIIKGNIKTFNLLLLKSPRDYLYIGTPVILKKCLHLAVSHRRVEMVQALCSFRGWDVGEHIHDLDWDGSTPLHLAAECGDVQILRILLEYVEPRLGAEFRYDGICRPLWLATSNGHLDALKLLEPFFNVDNPDYGSERTPLAIAAEEGFTDCVQYLLSLNGSGQVRINVNFRNFEHSQTPLDLAISGNHTDCIRLIKEHGGLTKEELIAAQACGEENNPM
jgi:ankyrin repeat protein